METPGSDDDVATLPSSSSSDSETGEKSQTQRTEDQPVTDELRTELEQVGGNSESPVDGQYIRINGTVELE